MRDLYMSGQLAPLCAKFISLASVSETAADLLFIYLRACRVIMACARIIEPDRVTLRPTRTIIYRHIANVFLRASFVREWTTQLE